MKKSSTIFWALVLLVFLFPFSEAFAQTDSFIFGPTNVPCNTTANFFFNAGSVNSFNGGNEPVIVPCNPNANWAVTLPNGTITSFSNTAGISTNLGSTPGIARITATTACGNGNSFDFDDADFFVSVGGFPLATPSLSGTNFLCNNSTTTYIASEVPGAATYTFEVADGFGLNGSSSTSITTSSRSVTVTAPPSGSGNGTIRVRANPINGCDLESNFRTQFITYGVQEINILGPTQTDPNNLIQYSSNFIGISNFNWFAPSPWSVLSGTNGTGVLVQSPSTAGNYSISVTATSCGVTIGDTIGVSVTNGGSNGPGGDGIFVIADGGDISFPENISKGISNKKTVNIYPNPARDLLNLESTTTQKIQSVEIRSLQGEKILSQSLNNDSFIIDISNVRRGLYLVNLFMEDGNVVVRKLQVDNNNY